IRSDDAVSNRRETIVTRRAGGSLLALQPAPRASAGRRTNPYGDQMSSFRNLLIAASLALASAGVAHADDCSPPRINGKKYTSCKKSTEKTGQLTCDPNAKVGSAMRCGEKIETKYECTEVVEKKK